MHIPVVETPTNVDTSIEPRASMREGSFKDGMNDHEPNPNLGSGCPFG